MALQQSARNRHTRGDVAWRWWFVAASGVLALGGVLASCATGGPGADVPGQDSGGGADVVSAHDDARKGNGDDDTGSGEDAGALDSGGGLRDASLDATDEGTLPPDDGSTQDESSSGDASPLDAQDASPVEAAPIDATPVDSSPVDSSPVDVTPPVDTGGGTDANGTDATGTQDSSTTCGGLPEWFAGTTAQQVQHKGKRYTCIQPGWCDQSGTSAVLAWEPGVGSAWQQAWMDSGACP
jgi:hypothetical protein